jgi:hypothetical protein
MGGFSERDVEDVLEGVQPPGRDDLAHVVELTTWLHASSEIEPPPAMRDDLFCQIEDGLSVYQRSSRRSPAHLAPDRGGMRRMARRTLAGSGRPIASLAAAAVLLVGVILAVRAGGPTREPSAFVSPSAQRLPAPGGGTPSSSTTLAPTTTSPPRAASAAPPATAATLPDAESSATVPASPAPNRASPAPDPMSESDPQAGAAGDTTPPADQSGPVANDAGLVPESEDDSNDRRLQAPQSDPADETTKWNLPLSGWSFDLSEWLPAQDLWAALDEAEDMREAVDEQDAGGGDDDRRRARLMDGEGEGDHNSDGATERDHTSDGKSEGYRETRDESERDRNADGESERQDDADPVQETSHTG